MPRGNNRNTPRGDPLAGWQKDNLAAPKRNQQPAKEFPPSVYDDRGLAPAPVAEPTREVTRAITIPLPQPLAHVQVPSGGDGGELKKLVEEEKRACPEGDIRWPPPKSAYSKPLHLLLDEKGEKRIYYHLIYKNSTPEAKHWKEEIRSKAEFHYRQKFPPPPVIKEEGKSAPQIQQEKEQAEIDNKGRARGAIITAKMQRKLREISFGPRGTIWLLEEEHVDIWRCIEIVQKASPPHNAVNLGATTEKFEIFGIGLKGEKDHVLLVSQRVEIS